MLEVVMLPRLGLRLRYCLELLYAIPYFIRMLELVHDTYDNGPHAHASATRGCGMYAPISD